MAGPLDLRRLAVRIEALQQKRTNGWHPADEMEFKKALPGGRGRRVLPDPEWLRGAAREMVDDTFSANDEKELNAGWRMWTQRVLDLEGLAARNDPRNPRRMMRDMARGRLPGRFGARRRMVEPPPDDPLERAVELLEQAVSSALED